MGASVVPDGTWLCSGVPNPALKRWAILRRPAGLRASWNRTQTEVPGSTPAPGRGWPRPRGQHLRLAKDSRATHSVPPPVFSARARKTAPGAGALPIATSEPVGKPRRAKENSPAFQRWDRLPEGASPGRDGRTAAGGWELLSSLTGLLVFARSEPSVETLGYCLSPAGAPTFASASVNFPNHADKNVGAPTSGFMAPRRGLETVEACHEPARGQPVRLGRPAGAGHRRWADR